MSLTGTPQNYWGGQHAKVLAAWTGTLDLAKPTSTVQSYATSATNFTLTDTLATFGSIVNAPLTIIAGTGLGQTRRIIAVNGQTLSLDRPWSILPDVSSQYQIGGICWRYLSSWYRFSRAEEMADRRFELLFEPLTNPAVANLRFFSDFSGKPDSMGVSMASDQGGGIASTAGQATLPIDMTVPSGLVSLRQPTSKEYFSRGKRYQQFELSGVSNLDVARIAQIMWEGLVPHSGGGNAGG